MKGGREIRYINRRENRYNRSSEEAVDTELSSATVA
jgi:hypothetical protein